MHSLQTPSELSVMFHDDHAVANRKWVAIVVHSLVVGCSCIDDSDVLKWGSTASVLPHRVMASSTLGTFLRRFTRGRVRKLDAVAEQLLTGSRP